MGSTAISFNVSGLQPGTTYHYRLLGANDTGTSMASIAALLPQRSSTPTAMAFLTTTKLPMVSIRMTPPTAARIPTATA